MSSHDPVKNPSHYDLFPGQQAIDVIRAALTPEEFAGYLKGNVLKYRLRAGAKGAAAEDLAKADKYRSWLMEQAHPLQTTPPVVVKVGQVGASPEDAKRIQAAMAIDIAKFNPPSPGLKVHDHDGSGCPVERHTRVNFLRANGEWVKGAPAIGPECPGDWKWQPGGSLRIVAYQVLRTACSPPPAAPTATPSESAPAAATHWQKDYQRWVAVGAAGGYSEWLRGAWFTVKPGAINKKWLAGLQPIEA